MTESLNVIAHLSALALAAVVLLIIMRRFISSRIRRPPQVRVNATSARDRHRRSR